MQPVSSNHEKLRPGYRGVKEREDKIEELNIYIWVILIKHNLSIFYYQSSQKSSTNQNYSA